MSSNSNSLQVKNFFNRAEDLRSTFNNNFADPKKTLSTRFVWDFWHVPDQYTHFRTPAWEYFSKKLYSEFHSQLVQWGREQLGCHNVSPPWLSYYVDGCRQELHSDRPHGPWAFVFSLTNWKQRVFRGGETLLLNNNILTYWQNLKIHQSTESHQAFTKLSPFFNALTIFDARIPHAVSEVKGTLNPLESRLVIHGWFVNPRPYLKGPLNAQAAQKGIEDLLEALNNDALFQQDLDGYLCLRMNILKSGKISNLNIVQNTLKTRLGSVVPQNKIRAFFNQISKSIAFKKARGDSQLTLPIVFNF